MSEGFMEYVARSYAGDLERFGTAYTGDRKRLDLLPGGVRENIFICDAADPPLWDEFERAGLADPRRFAVVLTLEGTLFAGVHCYDPANFQAYESALPWTIYVEAYPGLGVRRPHILLTGVRDWGADGEALVEAGCVELLPAWASAYRATFGRSGKAVLTALASDPDMERNPYDALGPAIMAGLRRGLVRAASLAR